MRNYRLGIALRKWTTPVHWAFGVLCAVVATQHFPAGILLLLVFAGNQIWNDWAENKKEGCTDWWESFLVFCIVFSVALILDLVGVISIRWV